MKNYKDILEHQITETCENVLNEVKNDLEDILYQCDLTSQQTDLSKALELNNKSVQLLKELINKLT